MAKAADRRDKVISFTTSHTTAALMDMLASTRGFTRSEYIRYLVIKDAPAATSDVIALAIDEGIMANGQRVKGVMDPGEEFRDDARAEYEKLSQEYKEVMANEATDIFEVDADGVPRLKISDDQSLTFDEFNMLPREKRVEAITAVMKRHHG